MTTDPSSDDGSLWAMPLEQRFWAKVDKRAPDECWPWMGSISATGYGRWQVKGRNATASRIALELTLGRDLRAGELACHRCDNPPCCNPAHLFLGTYADNVADMVTKGRQHRWNGARAGTNNPRAKLNPEDVAKIRSLIGKVSHRKIAQQYGLGATTIGHIASGKNWANE